MSTNRSGFAGGFGWVIGGLAGIATVVAAVITIQSYYGKGEDPGMNDHKANQAPNEKTPTVANEPDSRPATDSDLESEFAKGESVVDQLMKRNEACQTRIAELESRIKQCCPEKCPQELRERARDPRIQANYYPFLEKSNRRKKTLVVLDEPRPCSLQNLKTIGALYDYPSFAQVGANIQPYHLTGGNHWPMEDDGRPKWGCPNTDGEYEVYRQRYNEFMDLADCWVEMKLLDP